MLAAALLFAAWANVSSAQDVELLVDYEADVDTCFDAIAASGSKLDGKVIEVSFVVDWNGEVVHVEGVASDFNDEVLESCVVGKVKARRFICPTDGTWSHHNDRITITLSQRRVDEWYDNDTRPASVRVVFDRSSRQEEPRPDRASHETESRPDRRRAVATQPPEEEPVCERTVYTLSSGDTLESIAEQSGVSFKQIVEWNVFTGMMVPPGSTKIDIRSLLVPPGSKIDLWLPPRGAETCRMPDFAKPDCVRTSYRLQEGETAADVIQKFHIMADDLYDWNGPLIDWHGPFTLWLPPEGVETCHVPDEVRRRPVERELGHTIQEGDTIASLACKYGVTDRVIRKSNGLDNPEVDLPGLDPHSLWPNNILWIRERNETSGSPWPPGVSAGWRCSVYEVVPYDILSSIAADHCVTVWDVEHWNFIDEDGLKVGQRLVIWEPPRCKPECREERDIPRGDDDLSEGPRGVEPGSERLSYTVVEGDTVRGIASLFAVTQADLRAWNDLDFDDEVEPGDTVFVWAAPLYDNRGCNSREK